MKASASSPTSTSTVRAWLQLLRVSNLPSAWANILMAFLLVNGSWTPSVELVLLLLASTSLYLAGMVLNDVFDLEIDRQQRPHRPLPSGQIGWNTARITGYGLLVTGVLLAIVSGGLATAADSQTTAGLLGMPVLRAGLIASILAIAIWSYDGPLKRTVAAIPIMGACRSLNLLLGASTWSPALSGEELWVDPILGLPWRIWWVAGAIGILIAGVTWFGRKEAETEQSRMSLIGAALTIGIGLTGISLTARVVETLSASDAIRTRFQLFVLFASILIMIRIMIAVFRPTPRTIQLGVVAVLRSLVVLDAALCFLAQPGNPGYAIAVAALFVAGMYLGRFIRST